MPRGRPPARDSRARDTVDEMSQDKVAVFRRAVERFNLRDTDAVAALVTEDFEFVPYLAAILETSTYRGAEGLRQYRRDADAAWDEILVLLDSVRSLGDRLLATGELRGRGRGSGLEVELPLTWLAEFRGDRLSSVRSYASESEAVEAAGVRE